MTKESGTMADIYDNCRHKQTSPVAHPSIALARMAWCLAWSRRQPYLSRHTDFVDIERATLEMYDRNGWSLPNSFPATREYYRICDRIARGERP